MEYKRSMIIYDLDSLIGVNKSESESSMGTSVSSSVVNQSIYMYVTSRFCEAKIEAVVRDPFLLRKFTTDVDFTLTNDQQEKEEEEKRKANDVIVCVKCRDLYIESENKMGTCNYHNGFVYDNSALDLKKYRQSEAIDELNRDEFIALKDAKQKDDIDRRKSRFKYICCDSTVQAGGAISGCKKGKHGLDNKKRRRTARQVLDKRMVEMWETECFENLEYNERWADLFAKRRSVQH